MTAPLDSTTKETLAPTYLPVADLRNHPRNPRTIRPERLEQLARVLEADPLMMEARPLIALPDGTVIAGNQRLTAAVSLGWETVPVVTVDLDDARALEWALRDNESFGEWDDRMRAEILADLAGQGRELDFTGISRDEIEALLRVARNINPDAVPPMPVEDPVSRLGEVYELGAHRVMCGDSTDSEQVQELMAGVLAEMVFTDPPYGVGYDGGTKVRELLIGDETTELYAPACLMAAAFSTDDAPLYLWHAGVKGYAAAAAAAAAGYEIRCEIVWNKNHAQFGSLTAQYKQKHEPLYYCFKRGKTVNWSGPTNEVTIWDCDRASVNEYHPTQKPVELVTRALGNHTAMSVLDLFGGSGSTMIGAEQLGKRSFLMEVDPAYCDVIRRRYAVFVGDESLLP